MLKIFVCLLLLLNLCPVFAAKTANTTQSYSYYNPTYYSAQQEDLSALERYAFNRNYSGENEVQRLERLENLAFGAVQNGDLISRFHQVETAILSRPKTNGFKNSLANTLGNYIMGQTTGLTPSIVTSGFPPIYNNPQYTNSNIMQYSSFPFGGRGYRVMNQNYGANSGIRILP